MLSAEELFSSTNRSSSVGEEPVEDEMGMLEALMAVAVSGRNV